jgi:hypothetical protein
MSAARISEILLLCTIGVVWSAILLGIPPHSRAGVSAVSSWCRN